MRPWGAWRDPMLTRDGRTQVRTVQTDPPKLLSPEPGLAELDQPGFTDWISRCWGIPFETGQSPCRIHGSPERSMSRGVAGDSAGSLYLIEKFLPAQGSLKEQIAGTLGRLKHNGLDQVLEPEKSLEGGYLARYGNAVFQVTRFVEGTDLPRPGWLSSVARGEAMGGFLADMRRYTRNLSFSMPFFSIKDYIVKLFQEMAVHHPKRHVQYLSVLRFLEREFMEIHDRLPQAFCHGDFHPINVIWQGEKIRAVIDWEFTGIKPDCYDAANLLGCAGIEHPDGLVMPMATAFLARLHRAGVISPLAWRWLPEVVLALRFAWLSEWLRKEDGEMLETEFRFMEILMNQSEALREIWADAGS